MYFSVIVPVYQIEAYLKPCVDSILAQSFCDFELILVDDGSGDGCPAICDSYAAKDGRVRVIHKENGGLMSARKAGLRAAAGCYIVHVDGDDWIAPDFLERAYKLAEAYRTDVVSFAYSNEYEHHSEVVCEPVGEGFYQGEDIGKSLFPLFLLAEDMSHLAYPIWGKALKRELVTDIQLAADERIQFGEDAVCRVPIYLKAKSIYICAYPAYFYRIREQSYSHGFRMKQFFHLIYVVESFDRMDGSRIPDFKEQTDRYAASLCFVLLLEAVKSRAYGEIPGIRRAVGSSVLMEHVRRARFRRVTLKSRLVYVLIRHNRVRSVYVLLAVCEKMKAWIRHT